MEYLKLKLGSSEKLILQTLYLKTKKFIIESNRVGETFKMTAPELTQALGEGGQAIGTELSWYVQFLLDLEFIKRIENKIELTQKGRIYAAFLAKEISF